MKILPHEIGFNAMAYSEAFFDFKKSNKIESALLNLFM